MSRRKPISFLAIAALPITALAVAGCGGGGGATASGAPAVKPGEHAATVVVANDPTLGNVLEDSQGSTLYLFEHDTGTKSTCTGACAVSWPPLRATGKAVAGNGISASKLGTTPRSDGKPQVTYNGHPLYTFANDQSFGATAGQGVNAFGGLWYTVSPAGTADTTSPSSSSGGGGGGY
jgi:predicted lipoprotein with Yx(FWY)xxD motif